DRLDVAEHHRGRRPPAEAVPDAVDLQPVFGHHLAPCDRLTDAVDQYLRAPTGQAAKPGRLEPLEHLAERLLRDLGQEVDLRRAEAVDIDPGKMSLDVPEELLVPLELQIRMQPALHQDLVST